MNVLYTYLCAQNSIWNQVANTHSGCESCSYCQPRCDNRACTTLFDATLLFGGMGGRGWELPASHFSHWDMSSPFPDKKFLKPFRLPWQRGVGEEAGHGVAVGLTDVSQWELSPRCVQKVLAPSCCRLKLVPCIQLASPSPCKQMCLWLVYVETGLLGFPWGLRA